MARKKHAKKHEEEASEAWLLPYSDLMTLLLALFICLFAISQTDQTKLVQMAQAFTAAFNMGGPSFFDKAGPSNSMQREIVTSEDQGNAAYLQENQQLQDLQQKLEEYIQQNNLQDELSTQLEEEGLMIRIKEKALFPSGSRITAHRPDCRRTFGGGARTSFNLRPHRHRPDKYAAVPVKLGAQLRARNDLHEISVVD